MVDEHQYHHVEPIFDGSSVRVPFLKYFLCPGTFILFKKDDKRLVGQIVSAAMTEGGTVQVNWFHEVNAEGDVVTPFGHPYFQDPMEVCILF